MRIYRLTTDKKTLIIAAHTPHQALQVSGFKQARTEEVNITEPIIVCQENTQMAKSASTLEK